MQQQKTLFKFRYASLVCLNSFCNGFNKYCLAADSPGMIMWNSFFKILGILLIIFFNMLVTLILYSFFFDTCLIYYLVFKSKLITITMILLGVFFGFNIVFNFMMAAFTNPGDTSIFLEYNEEDYLKLKRYLGTEDLNVCKKCKTFKPERAHHCSICNKCILKMDHHCPWVNNCIGHNNQRYFLLMLFYLWFGLFVLLLFNMPICFMHDFIEYKDARSGFFVISATLDLTLVIILAIFDIWNFYLAFSGNTAIEFWGAKLESQDPRKAQKNYKTNVFVDNLNIIFGTRSFLKALCPSAKKLPYDGVKWSENTSIVGDEESGLKNESV